MTRACGKCARPLKPKQVIRAGKPVTVQVCKSPICKAYNRPQ